MVGLYRGVTNFSISAVLVIEGIDYLSNEAIASTPI